MVLILGIMLSAWCCRGQPLCYMWTILVKLTLPLLSGSFENPLCCPCYLCACCGGLGTSLLFSLFQFFYDVFTNKTLFFFSLDSMFGVYWLWTLCGSRVELTNYDLGGLYHICIIYYLVQSLFQLASQRLGIWTLL